MEIISTNNCSNCQKWNDGVCNNRDWLERREKPKEKNCGIYIHICDDSDLYFEFRTASDFGCIRFEKK